MALPRRPITVVLDGVRGNRTLGALFRLCDGFLVERLVVCRAKVKPRKPSLVRAACGAHDWVPWDRAESCVEVVTAAKAAGAWVVVAEATTASRSPNILAPAFPVCLVLGSDKRGLSQEVVDLADAAVTIPMEGMASGRNVTAGAAILLHWLSGACRPADTGDDG